MEEIPKGKFGGEGVKYSGAKIVFSQPLIVKVLPLKKMRAACNFP